MIMKLVNKNRKLWPYFVKLQHGENATELSRTVALKDLKVQ